MESERPQGDNASMSPSRKQVKSSDRMGSLDRVGIVERMSRTAHGFGNALGSGRKANSRALSQASNSAGKNDYTFRKTGLSVGEVAGTKRSQAFGFDHYTSPKIDTKYRIAFGNATQNTKLKNFTDIHAKNLQYIPGPKYVQHADWRHNIKGRTGKFLGAARSTFTDEVMAYEKKKPAPSKYDNKEALKKKEKVIGNYLVKENRTHFTDHTKWVTSQVPPAKYNNTNVKITKPKIFSASLGKTEPKGASSWVIPKMDGPGPGSYKTDEAIASTQLPKVKGQSKQTFYPLCFTDQHKKRFAHVPGSGHYKQLETAEKRASKDKNFKYNRH